MVLVALAAALVTVVVDARPAAACSCAGTSDAEARGHADVVFLGEVRDVRMPNSGFSGAEATVWFDVSAVYEGEAYAEQAVATAQSSASCGLELNQMEGPVLVFAERVDGGGALDEQRLEAGLCGGTRAAGRSPIPESWTVSAPVAGVSDAGSGSSALPVVAVAGAVALAGAAIAAAVVLVLRRRTA